MKKSHFLSFLIMLFTFPFQSKASNGQAEELGTVHWLRDYNQAIALAKAENKQVLILFQEVPGCSTCRNYGHNVLSNPLMVEAIEQYFVPLAIFNNKGGEDALILSKYNEPSWNNPVVRIVDQQGQNVVPRLASNYSAVGLYQSMDAALTKAKRSTAAYFQLLGEELLAQKNGTIQESYFKMYCFWSGEGHLGQQEGVLSTEPGFIGGNEIVKVSYDANKVSQAQLQTHAAKANCTPMAAKEGYRTDKDVQYYLKKSVYQYLPLSQIQRTKVNSALANGRDPKEYLSPQQLKWLEQVKAKTGKHPVLYDQPIEKAWAAWSNG